MIASELVRPGGHSVVLFFSALSFRDQLQDAVSSLSQDSFFFVLEHSHLAHEKRVAGCDRNSVFYTVCLLPHQSRTRQVCR